MTDELLRNDRVAILDGMVDPSTGRIPTLTLADRLRLARTTAGLEQTELADAMAMSRTTVVKYESGQLPGGRLGKHLQRKLELWARTTGVDPTWLIDGP